MRTPKGYILLQTGYEYSGKKTKRGFQLLNELCIFAKKNGNIYVQMGPLNFAITHVQN